MYSSKYKAIKTKIDGVLFDSKAESRMYMELKILEKAGQIKDLQLQPHFVLQEGFTNANGKRIRPIAYTADFSFYDCASKRFRIVDCKGFATSVYKLKKKLFDYLMKEQNLYLEETI